MKTLIAALLALVLLATLPVLASDDNVVLTGIVSDPTAAVVPQVTVIVRNSATATEEKTSTREDGSYSFLSLPPGLYDLRISSPGFRPQSIKALQLTSGKTLKLDITLALAEQSTIVEVSADLPQLDLSSTQIGESLSGTQMRSVPVNGRSFTDLLAMQPGVVPTSSAQPNAVVMSGCTNTPPSGDLDPGNLSVSGQRETANGFSVNGSIVEEGFNNGTAVVPDLDSIADMRVLTNNFDAEYGNYSGGQVLLTTKSGNNDLHGGAFEFLRNTGLDARNYFAPERAAYDRHQFGGSLGGPVIKNKLYFFADYQSTKMTQGQETGAIVVPSAADRSGNLVDLAGQLTGEVSSTYWASQLSQKLGYAVSAGESYYSGSACTSKTQCVFPNAQIPSTIWSLPAKSLLQYIPQPNAGTNLFSSSSENETVTDNKASVRFDTHTHFGDLSGYYFFDQYAMNNPYPTGQGGANVPGFNALSDGRAQLYSLGLTRAWGVNTVNELRFSYLRYANLIGQPFGGVGPSLASQGFVEGEGTLGIVPLNRSIEGVENVAFNDFTIGVDVTGESQINNTYQWSDNLTHVIGPHTLKFGGGFHIDQVNIKSNSINNGSFLFQGTETGSDFADYLLGIASTYEQGDASPFYIRNKYIGAFAQDSWKLRSNLTLNYGLRWDVLPPWREKYNQLQTFVLGQQSEVYPGAPAGIVFPGDRGIPSTLAPTRWADFSPRLGVAYSPNFDDGLLRDFFGGPGKTSIHAGFGLFHTAIEGLSAGIMSACAPYGYDYDSTGGRPLFNEPFRSATTGGTNGQPFPSPIPAFGASVTHPNNTVDWSKYNPITGDPAFYYRNVSPYTESYNLSFEREVASSTFLHASYIGSQAHRLLVLTSADPGNSALCRSVSQPDQVLPGSPTCGPFGEGGIFTRADGTKVQVRGPFGSSFDGITYQKTIASSNYSAFEFSLRHTSHRLEMLAGYTYGKSLDDSSSLSEPVYPMGANLTKALSGFDIRHSFVVSYKYDLPFEALFHAQNRLTTGWTFSGITRFSTGLPVTLFNNTDSSLLGSMPNGINNNGVDTPYYIPGNLEINHNARNHQSAFNTSLFPSDVSPYLGQIGNASRRFFYGPGLNNFDIALEKQLVVTEGKSLEFRMEAFNVFNHAQFFGAATVNGNISSAGFGQIVSVQPPRLMQAAVKFQF
ncbi:MAG TPA: TonB-dependent receptor [Candidatus Eisenbacteria bacterium]|nr:TonB-dependent receptor [Candidatus Eisenbacteria bacterium]